MRNTAYGRSELAKRLTLGRTMPNTTSDCREILQTLASLGEPVASADTILRELVKRTNADIGCLYVPTASEQTLTAAAVHPESLWSVSPQLGTTFMTRDRASGGIGKAIRDRRTLLIDDPTGAEGRGEYIPFFPDVTSEIIVPVFDEDSLGAVLVVSKQSQPLLGTEEQATAEFLSDLLTLVYRVQREKIRREAELDFLKSITHIGTSTPDLLFARFLESVGAFLPSRFISLWLYNSLDGTLVMRGFYPPVIGSLRISFDQVDSTVLSLDSCLSAITIREQRPQVFENIQANPKNANSLFARRHGLNSFVSFPVIDEDRRVLAILNVYPHAGSDRIPDEKIEAAAVLLSQLAPRLTLSGMKRREAMLGVYGKICRRIRNDNLDSEIWDALAARITIDMQCEACSIFLFDEKTGALVLRGSTGIEGNPAYREVWYKVGEGLTGLAFRRQSPVLYYRDLEVKYTGHHLSKFREKLRTTERSRSILIQAIFREDGDAIGVIRCNNKKQTPRSNCGRFSEEDVGVIQMIGSVLSDWLDVERNFSLVDLP